MPRSSIYSLIYKQKFMGSYDRGLLQILHQIPAMQWRHIDNFATWTHGKEHVLKFLNQINCFYANIKFTVKLSSMSMSFDATVSLEEGKSFTDLYTKLMDMHQYLHHIRFHPSHCKCGISYTRQLGTKHRTDSLQICQLPFQGR